MLRCSHVSVLSQQNRRQWNIQLLNWGRGKPIFYTNRFIWYLRKLRRFKAKGKSDSLTLSHGIRSRNTLQCSSVQSSDTNGQIFVSSHPRAGDQHRTCFYQSDASNISLLSSSTMISFLLSPFVFAPFSLFIYVH